MRSVRGRSRCVSAPDGFDHQLRGLAAQYCCCPVIRLTSRTQGDFKRLPSPSGSGWSRSRRSRSPRGSRHASSLIPTRWAWPKQRPTVGAAARARRRVAPDQEDAQPRCTAEVIGPTRYSSSRPFTTVPHLGRAIEVDQLEAHRTVRSPTKDGDQVRPADRCGGCPRGLRLPQYPANARTRSTWPPIDHTTSQATNA
jgi:hypothetical protein